MSKVPFRAPTAFIQIACGFSRRPRNSSDIHALSPIDFARGIETSLIYRPGDQIYLTGIVPYDAAFPEIKLSTLNIGILKHLLGSDINVLEVIGQNAFSESWNACLAIKMSGYKKVTVVTSDFYLIAYRRVWEAAATRQDIEIDFREVNNSDLVSPDVWDFYKGIRAQLLSRLAASSKQGHQLAKVLADHLTRNRLTKGFKFNGHTKIG